MSTSRILSLALIVLTLIAGCAQQRPSPSSPEPRIRVRGTDFVVNGQRIWLNGANTPWISWNDFGGKFDAAKWDAEFAALAANGINATRIWITCNGAGAINISDDGIVSGATDAHWRDLDTLFDIARRHRVYIKATLTSFDHFKAPNLNHLAWRKLVMADAAIDAYVQNYVIPFVERYRDNPYLFAIEPCNEIEWVFDGELQGKIDVGHLQLFVAKIAKAVHDRSDILVTQGTAVIKWDFFTDDHLQAKVPDPNARVDFYSPHTYDWQIKWFGIPFYMTPGAYKVRTDKPAIVGECPAKGSGGHSIREDYHHAYLNGWAGVMAWTSNGIDRNGSLKQLRFATNFMQEQYPQYIRK